VHEEQRGLRAAKLFHPAPHSAEEQRRRKLPVAKQQRGGVHSLERAIGNTERRDEQRQDRNQRDGELRPDRHAHAWHQYKISAAG